VSCNQALNVEKHCRVTKQAAVPSFLEGGGSEIKPIGLITPWRFESFSYSILKGNHFGFLFS